MSRVGSPRSQKNSENEVANSMQTTLLSNDTGSPSSESESHLPGVPWCTIAWYEGANVDLIVPQTVMVSRLYGQEKGWTPPVRRQSGPARGNNSSERELPIGFQEGLKRCSREK